MASAAISSDCLEFRISELLDSGAVTEAISLAVSSYGEELLSFLQASHRAPDEAREVFGQTCEDLVRSIGAYRRSCSFRTWMYSLARHASLRFRDSERRHRHERLSLAPELAQAVRTTTAAFLKDSWKDRFRGLRDSLSEEDRLLLLLRVDRQLDWREIAQVWEGPGARADRTAARLRKRFERIKAELRDLARQAGWWQEL